MTLHEDPVAALASRLRSRHAGFALAARRPVVLARAPGRLDIMGGIADYTGSLVCEMPIAAAAAVAVQKREDRRLSITTFNTPADVPSGTVEISLDDFYGSGSLLPAPAIAALFTAEKRWASYLAGAYWVLARKRKLNRHAAGANIACYSTVPLGAGVSSSAALEVATLCAITKAYHLLLDPMETALLAQRVENQVVGAPCGVMDQVTSMLGRAQKLLLLKCQPHTVQGYAQLPPGVTCIGINSNVKHSVGGSAYRSTRVAAAMAHAILLYVARTIGFRGDFTGGYLANLDPVFYRRFLRRMLPKTLSGKVFLSRFGNPVDPAAHVEAGTVYHVRAAADHHVLENQRVERFVQALEAAGNNPAMLQRAGRLMLAAHSSYSHRAFLGSQQTDLLVQLLMKQGPAKGIYGARVTGGGSGGTVAILCNAGAAETLQQVCADYAQATGLTPHIIDGSSDGAAHTEPILMTP